MKRIDAVYKKLCELTIENGITAGELASDLGLTRANVSGDLNKLCEDNKAYKEGGKPVFYHAMANAKSFFESSLDQFVHNNQSLFNAAEQAKAAVLYPPNGMNILILGETGVGKSMFAGMIHKYAVEMGRMESDSTFITFNCADYANNPQLLVSQLFGVKKGAFTGADTDRAGLIEKADNGILFLDEVHRLPPEGQEMLFLFMDKGVFRRLGETDSVRTSRVLIISATTENPDSVLLRTFTRRIPMIIRIPNLHERNIGERLNLITLFFREESIKLGRPIYLSVNSMRSLLSFHCPNNVGQLRTEIQLICAKAYSDFISGKKEELVVAFFELPPYIKEGLYLETDHRQIWNRLIGINKRFCVFDGKANNLMFETLDDAENIYERIDSLFAALKQKGAGSDEINDQIDREIGSYFEKYLEMQRDRTDFAAIQKFTGQEIIELTNRIVDFSQAQLGRTLEDNIKYGMAIHIFNSINRVRHGKRISNPQLNSIRREHKSEFEVAVGCLGIIDDSCELSMPVDEAGFLAMFFVLDRNKLREQRNFIKVIVIAHGDSTASSLSGTVNRLLGTDGSIGIDAPLDTNPQHTYRALKDYLLEHPEFKNVLLLVDMGSLTNLGEDVKSELGINVKTVPLVSTLHVLEATRKAMMGYSLECVYNETLKVSEFSKSFGDEKPQSGPDKFYIVTVCTTGLGGAMTVKHFLEQKLKYDKSRVEILPLSLAAGDDVGEKLRGIERNGKLLLAVSPFALEADIPRYGLDQIFLEDTIKEVQSVVDQEITFANIGETLDNLLEHINANAALQDIRGFTKNVNDRLGVSPDVNMLIGVFCHMGCMLDRLKQGKSAGAFPEKELYIKSHPRVFETVRQEIQKLDQKYQVAIPDDEICYICTFFEHENQRWAE